MNIIWIAACCMGTALQASWFDLQDYKEPVALCMGNIVFPEPISPDLSLYYKGNKLQLDVEENKQVDTVPYSLVEGKTTQKLHVLICSELGFATDENTVLYLHVPDAVGYKFFVLSAARKYNKNNELQGYFWEVQELELADDRIIPDDTMIFLFDANLIESLEVRSWVKDNNIRLLPDIVIKKSVSTHMLSRTIAISRLAAIDLDTIHQRNFKHIKQKNSRAVAMMVS